jgi:small subunit ribosomal protein S4
MNKRNKRIYQICRRLGFDLWGKFYNIEYDKRPGQQRKGQYFSKKHPTSTGDSVKSIFTIQRILQRYYSNVSLRQLKRLARIKDVALSSLLERRVDTFLYRTNLVKTIQEARHLISHGHVFINSNRIYISSHLIKIGDIIEISPSIKQQIKERLLQSLPQTRINVPHYFEINYNLLIGTLLYHPKIKEIPYPINPTSTDLYEFEKNKIFK